MSAPADIVDRLRDHAIDCVTAANEIDFLRSEIERLRAGLRAVRACSDPVWAAQIISDALRENEP